MVQLAGYSNLRPEPELPVKRLPATPAGDPVKLEIEDQLEDEDGPHDKRPKMTPVQQLGTSQSMSQTEAIQYNLLNEPSPLGLRLRKSPSLLDLIQMRLSRANTAVNSCTINNESLEDEKKNDIKSIGALTNNEKLKASNFPASLLRIGTWEYVSRYEGDLVAKCYFAKRKLVWEILEGGLKSKIEIQWSDITALKVTSPDNGPGTLDIVLARQPLFFRETNPQPRKHTLWQATSDFTDGQARIHRRHFLQCPQGLLSKHFEKLLHCDPRLCALSLEPDIALESPFFEPGCSVFEDQEEFKCQPYDKLKDAYGSAIREFHDSSSALASTSASLKSDIRDSFGTLSDVTIGEIHAPNSGSFGTMLSAMKPVLIKGVNAAKTENTNTQNCWDQFKVPGMTPSMSVSDFINQLEHCLSEQISSGNAQLSGTDLPDKERLEELVQCLFNDSQLPASDEKSVMTKVNSFCSLLQAGAAQVQQTDGDGTSVGDAAPRDGLSESSVSIVNEDTFRHKAANISRKDSFGDLLMQLPRIASLSQLLFNIEEEEEDSYPPSPSN